MFEHIPNANNQETETEPTESKATITEFFPEREWNKEENEAIEIIRLLKDNHAEAYFVGGAVRDYLLGRDPKDIDIATSASMEQIKNIFGNRAYYLGQQEKHGIIVIKTDKENTEEACGGGIEIAVFRKDIYEENLDEENGETEGMDPNGQKHVRGRHADKVQTEGVTAAEDATRRDLTINALFYDPITGEVVDYVGGLEDLKNKIIRFAGDPTENIMQDRIRLIRYFRFKGTLEFEEDEASAQAVRAWLADENNRNEFKEMFHLNQRIRTEMTKILKSKNRIAILEDLMETGLMELIIPEIYNMQKIEQPRKHHSEGNAWEHTKLCLQNLPEDAPEELIWATLLHDIGKENKGEEQEKQDQEKITFYSHEKLSAQLARSILKAPSKSANLEEYEKMQKDPDSREKIDKEDFAREKRISKEGLGFDNEFVDKVVWLVANHMKKSDFLIMKDSKKKELMENPDFPLLLELWKIDSRGGIPEDESRIPQKEQRLTDIAKIYEDFKIEDAKNRTNVQSSKERGDFIDSNEILSYLKQSENGSDWTMNTKSGVLFFESLSFHSIVPALSDHLKKLFAENENYSREEAQQEIKRIIKEDGILHGILREIVKNEDIVSLQTDIANLSEKPKAQKIPRKELDKKTNELFRELFEEKTQ
ncbi:MAG: CCA tRNA nucleotidyltransferase [Candidatus Paceibacterota bacterium]